MSHFTVAVFSHSPEDVESLLAPFNECVDSASPYAVFEKDEDYDPDETTGERGYWHNPNARWDWFVRGGRWPKFLKLKPDRQANHFDDEVKSQNNPARCDVALVADCDFSPDLKHKAFYERDWEIQVDGSPLREGEKAEDHLRIYKPAYYLHKYGTKEKYVKSMTDFHTFAYLTPEGQWFEPGKMGWFAYDDSTAESREDYEKKFTEYLVEAEKQGLYITIVDAHI